MASPLRSRALGAGHWLASLAGALLFAACSPEPAPSEQVGTGHAPFAPPTEPGGAPVDAPPAPREPPPTPPPPPRDFAGTFVVERLDGSEDRAASGSFELVLWGASSGAPEPVQVQGGQWRKRIEGADAADLRALSLTAASTVTRAALVVSPAGRFEPEDPARIEVRVREARTSVLRVTDAATGLDLDGIELLHGGSHDTHRHPGAEHSSRALGSELVSPIDLGQGLGLRVGTTVLLARAPGYAWGSIELEIGGGNLRVLELAPGGDLRLTFSGVDPAAALIARIRRADDTSAEPLVESSVRSSDELALDGLLPGRYFAELGESWDARGQLGAVEFEILPGATCEALLDIPAPPPPERATAAGVVLLPKEWALERLNGALRSLSPGGGNANLRFELAADEGEALAFRWSAPDLPVGPLVLSLYKPLHNELLELPSGGRADFRIELQPPGELVVRLIDALTGERVRPPQLLWHPEFPPGVNGGALETVPYDEKLDGFLVRALPGRVRIAASGAGFEIPDPALRVEPGRNEVELAVRALTELEVVLLDGGVPQPFPDGWALRVRTDSGAELRVFPIYSTALRRYRLPAGGRYQIEFDPVPGYQGIPERAFDVLDGQLNRLEVPLEKQR